MAVSGYEGPCLSTFDVHPLLTSHAHDWDNLGQKLEVEVGYRKQLQMAGQTMNDSTKLESIIERWLMSWCSEPSWDNLIRAMDSLKWTTTVKEVKKYLKTEEAIKKYNWKESTIINTTSATEEIPGVEDALIDSYTQQIEGNVFQNSEKRHQGIIFIVGVYGVAGSEIDVKRVQTTFENPKLNFTIIIVQDPNTIRLRSLIVSAARYEYPIRYKFIAFYFSGHGGADKEGNLVVQTCDKQQVAIERYITEPMENLNKHVRLFFFDCCQSKSESVQSKATTGGPRSLTSEPLRIVKPKRTHGQVIAYAVSKGQKAYGDSSEGGEWTRRLCENLLKPDPITTVLTNTNEAMKNSEFGQQMQPTTVSNVPIVVICKNDAKISKPDEKTLNADAAQNKKDIKPKESTNTPSNKEGITLRPIRVEEVCTCLDTEAHQYWTNIALELQVDFDSLENDTSLPTKKDKLEKVIHIWISNCTFNVSWNDIITVVRELGLTACAENLEQVSRKPLKKVTLTKVYTCLRNQFRYWKSLALELNVELEGLDKHPSDKIRLSGVIETWIKNETCEVSWQKIISVVKDLGLNDEAQTLEQNLRE